MTTILCEIIQLFILKNTIFAIKEYLEMNISFEEITSFGCQKTKNNRRKNFREIVKKIKA